MKNKKCSSICSSISNGNLFLHDNWVIVFLNFSFSSGCDLYDRSQNCQKELSNCISVLHVTLFWLMMDLSVQKWNILLCLIKMSGFSVHPFWNHWICLTRSVRSMRSRVQLKLLSSNSKLTVREHWLIVLINFSFSCGCHSWINRLLFHEAWTWVTSADFIKGHSAL